MATLRQDVFFRLLDFARERAMSGQDRWVLTQSRAYRLGVDLGVILGKRILHIMTGQEIAAVASAGIDVQLHTHRHRVPQDSTLFEAEIVDNRERLEKLTGRTANHFCYPSGVIFSECIPWLKRLGIKSAATCEMGLHSPGDNLLLLRRFADTSGQSELHFETWLSGVGVALRTNRAFETTL